MVGRDKTNVIRLATAVAALFALVFSPFAMPAMASMHMAAATETIAGSNHSISDSDASCHEAPDAPADIGGMMQCWAACSAIAVAPDLVDQLKEPILGGSALDSPILTPIDFRPGFEPPPPRA